MLSTSWQNTEEEEFDWENMSPTLTDHSRNNSLLPSTFGFSRERPGVAANATLSEQDTRKGWSILNVFLHLMILRRYQISLLTLPCNCDEEMLEKNSVK